MNVKELADFKPSGILESSADPSKLSFALQKILGTREYFANDGIISEGPGSIRIFFANPKEGEAPLSVHCGHPRTIANNLMSAIGHNQVRHPDRLPGNRTKGWNIRSVEIDGRRAAVAEAAWV